MERGARAGGRDFRQRSMVNNIFFKSETMIPLAMPMLLRAMWGGGVRLVSYAHWLANGIDVAFGRGADGLGTRQVGSLGLTSIKDVDQVHAGTVQKLQAGLEPSHGAARSGYEVPLASGSSTERSSFGSRALKKGRASVFRPTRLGLLFHATPVLGVG